MLILLIIPSSVSNATDQPIFPMPSASSYKNDQRPFPYSQNPFLSRFFTAKNVVNDKLTTTLNATLAAHHDSSATVTTPTSSVYKTYAGTLIFNGYPELV